MYFVKPSQLISHCFDHYMDLFSGKITHPIILFPNANTAYINLHLQQINETYFKLNTYFKFIGDILSNSLNNNSSLHVLEVGSGQGLLTWNLLDYIKNNAQPDKFIYHFTDISRTFIAKAKQYALSNELSNFMQFSLFDFNINPDKQGVDKDNLDIIIAFDAIHNATNLHNSIHHLKSLLKPAGTLIILESTKLPLWLHFIWGVTPQWWSRAGENTMPGPLLSVDQWKQTINEVGFSEVFIFPGTDQLESSANYLAIICQK